MKPNPKEINIILNILKGAQFEFLPRAPFYIDTPLIILQIFSLFDGFQFVWNDLISFIEMGYC
jgi:hypothetical protein